MTGNYSFRPEASFTNTAQPHPGFFDNVSFYFDPAVHEAVGVAEGGEYESGTLAEEDRGGYLWQGELLRPARVIVAK